jgi:glycosyltransferase involved in cell wall biosynthesis
VHFEQFFGFTRPLARTVLWQLGCIYRIAFAKPDTIIFFSPLNYRNEYQRLLYSSLPKGTIAVFMPFKLIMWCLPFFSKKRWFYHQHWFYTKLFSSEQNQEKFLCGIRLLQKKGVCVIWTLHNAISHDAPDPQAEIQFYIKLANQVDHIHVHYQGAVEFIKNYYPIAEEKLIVAPHGNYLKRTTPYMAGIPAPAAMDTMRFFAGGMLRKYKGLEPLIELFHTEGRIPQKAQLVIAGLKKIDLVQPASPRVMLHAKAEILSETEFFRFVRTSHFTVLPYTRSLTSGVMLYSLSCGTPVIAPNYGHFKAILTSENAFLYDSENPNGLAEAITAACELRADAYARMRESAYQLALQYPWEESSHLMFRK